MTFTGRSILAFHHWAFLPGSIAQLRHASGDVMATIRSRSIGEHEWVEGGTIFASFHDAQRTVEKSAGGLR